MADPVLKIDNLSVALPAGGDRANAITDLSLTVNRGEILCVVGESGSGKSVTAQAVMGLLPKKQLRVTSGGVLLDGEDTVTATPARLRELRGTRMAMIFQEPMTALNPVMRVGAQIQEVLDIHTDLSSDAKRAKVLEIMDAVRLPDVTQLIDSYPHQLSGGQAARDDRAGAHPRPGAADRRRADDSARRDDAGADPDVDPRDAGAQGHGRAVHHP